MGHDDLVSDAAVLDALVTAEVALTRAWGAAGFAPESAVADISDAFGWAGRGAVCTRHGIDAAALAAASVAGGNPVIPLVGLLKEHVPDSARAWVHRGATSQDILDSALMLIAARAAAEVERHLARALENLVAFITAHAGTVAAARTLTQHAVPTTWGARAAGWSRGLERSRIRLAAIAGELPVQLGGAAGTLAALVERVGRTDASILPGFFARELALPGSATEPSDAPWHTARWPITELGDALVHVLDALGKIAGDVANASRTEVAELAEGAGGGSSAMPQKQNPVESVLIRSAAIRAPQLGATLHVASALAVDERPDGAWHAEWATLRELLRLALGASAHTATLLGGLRVDADAVARNLALTRGLIVSERLGIVLTPLIGRDRFAALIDAAAGGGDLRALVRALPEAAELDVDELLDPSRYLGMAPSYAEAILAEAHAGSADAASDHRTGGTTR
ncbi:MAG: adenylosuccinate lyase [Actinobacteria bacterium]|nr:adenylosuccinate lyase [Actinomycetota bacterium]